MYKTQEEAMSFLNQRLINDGIFGEQEIRKAIQDIVDSIPPSMADAYGETDEIKAANYYETYKTQVGNTSNVPDEKPAFEIQDHKPGDIVDKKKSTAFVVPVISDAIAEKIHARTKASTAERYKKQLATSIDAIVVENPKPSVLYKGVKVTPIATEERLAEIEKMLVPEEENLKAFKMIKEAVGKTKLPVFMNDASGKVRGVQISTPADGEDKNQIQQMLLTTEMLTGFLISDVLGRIPTGDTGIGVVLQKLEAVKKKSAKADATAAAGRPKLTWVGKSAAVKNDENLLVLNKVAVDEKGKKITKPGKLKIAQGIKVYVGDESNVTAKGERKTRTIRLSGEYEDIPVFDRKEPAYRDIFGDVKTKGIISGYMSEAEKAEANKVIQDAMIASVSGVLEGANLLGDKFASILDELQEVQEENSAATLAGFAE